MLLLALGAGRGRQFRNGPFQLELRHDNLAEQFGALASQRINRESRLIP